MGVEKRRLWTAVCLPVLVLLGFGSKFYAGPGAGWVNNSLAGVFYEVFWCLLVFQFPRRPNPTRIAVLILTITCILEFMQLWHPPFLESIRSHFLGRVLIGTSFDWLDFPHYILGCGIAWPWMTWWTRRPKLSGPRPPAQG